MYNFNLIFTMIELISSNFIIFLIFFSFDKKFYINYYFMKNWIFPLLEFYKDYFYKNNFFALISFQIFVIKKINNY